MGSKAVAWPVIGYVGANGSGKTLAMTEDLAVPFLDDHSPCRCGKCDGVPLTILANYRIDSTNFVPLRSWGQLVTAHNSRVLLDEISAVLPSRQAMSVPPQLMRVINQLRKAECILGWTAPAWARCDTALREVTQCAVVCRGYMTDRYRRQPGQYRFPSRGRPVLNAAGKREAVPTWPPHCLFSYSYYDAREMDEFSYGSVESVKAKSHRYYWRPAHRAHLVYRTMEAVDLLDHLDDVGACFTCGGSRPRRKCVCKLESPFEPAPGEALVVPSVEGPGPVGVRVRGPRAARPRRGREGGDLGDPVRPGDVRADLGAGVDGAA